MRIGPELQSPNYHELLTWRTFSINYDIMPYSTLYILVVCFFFLIFYLKIKVCIYICEAYVNGFHNAQLYIGCLLNLKK